MNQFIQSNLLSIIFNILFNLPVFYYKISFINQWPPYLIIEILLIFLLNNLLFYFIFYIKHINKFLITLFFLIGGISNYYIVTHHKIFDVGIMIDFLSVEHDLIVEYLDVKMIATAFFFAICGYYLSANRFLPKSTTSCKTFIVGNALIGIFCLIGFPLIKHQINLQRMLISYFPYNIFYNSYNFTHNYLPALRKIKYKINPIHAHSLELASKSSKPLLIVLIIGESMRGDMISLNGYPVNNMPRMQNTDNIISFSHATSSSTATRISLPYMLTRATPPNFQQALEELSIISLFKSLGFTTSWIGNQGAFGLYETTYASIVMEADYFLLQPQIKKIYSNNKTHDEYLINLISNRVQEVKGNHFLVIHLMGSHWQFKARYPSSFKELASPSCKKSNPAECSHDELINAYNNTIFYTDYVLSKIIDIFKPHNAFLIYSSDHGFSLGEDKIHGNGWLEEPLPKAQKNIAMFTWASKDFLTDYETHYKQILSKKFNHITHDHIFHSLLGCIGVKSELIKKDLNLCY